MGEVDKQNIALEWQKSRSTSKDGILTKTWDMIKTLGEQAF